MHAKRDWDISFLSDFKLEPFLITKSLMKTGNYLFKKIFIGFLNKLLIIRAFFSLIK